MDAVLREEVMPVPRTTTPTLLLLQMNMRMVVRNRATLFWSLAFPCAFLALFGAMYAGQSVNNAVAGAPSFIDYFVPGIVVTSIMSTGIVSNAIALATLRARGVLRRIEATPVSALTFLVTRIIVQTVVMFVESAILIALAMLIFGADFSVDHLLSAIPGLILGSLACIAIGQALASLVPKPETVTLVGQVVYFPLMFLSGILIPLNALPPILQTIGQWLPSAALGTILRTAMVGPTPGVIQPPLGAAYLIVVVTLVIALGIAAKLFDWE